MATDLFPKTCALIKRSDYSRELADFSVWLWAEQYTPFVIHQHLLRLKEVLPRLPRSGESNTYAVAGLETAFDVGNGLLSRIYRFEGTRRAYTRFLQSRGRLREPHVHDRFADLQREYAEFLETVRGLSVSARRHHAHTVADFLVRGVGTDRSIAELTALNVERFVVRRARELSRHSMQHVVAHLRSFLRFCHDRGDLPSRLDRQIDTPRIYRDELPPRALPWEQVQVLLESIDRQGKGGWRDYCILHLVAHYGLRPSEVVTLRLDSIDWDNAVLHVIQHKTRSELILPIAAPTLELLRDYLAQERLRQESDDPELFLRLRCPHGSLQHWAVTDLFHKRMREAGLPKRTGGVYSLRHAFAMRLLSRGVGVKAIGDLLGHRDLNSTCTYLRLDIETLRDVALEIPGVADAGDGGCHDNL